MFIEVIHINGQYDPATKQHTPPQGAAAILPFLHEATEVAIASGAEVLYKPNLGHNAGWIAYDVGASAVALAAIRTCLV